MKYTDLDSFLSDSSALPRTGALIRENGLRVLLLHLKADEQIPEHQTRGAITVQCLKGGVSFFVGEEKAELKTGRLISLPPDAPHKLTGQQDSVLLVTISEPLPPASPN